MPNPRPDLQGFADPSVPGWQQRALGRVMERQAKSNRKNQRTNGLYLFFDDPLRVLLHTPVGLVWPEQWLVLFRLLHARGQQPSGPAAEPGR